MPLLEWLCLCLMERNVVSRHALFPQEVIHLAGLLLLHTVGLAVSSEVMGTQC